MAVESAGPYASLHLAPDRQPRQHSTAQFFTSQMPFLPSNRQRQSTEGNSWVPQAVFQISLCFISNIKIKHTRTHLTALFPGLPRWAGTRKVKPIWILLKQETGSGSDISWATCKSAPCSRQITTPALSFFTGRMPFLLPNQQHQTLHSNCHPTL